MAIELTKLELFVERTHRNVGPAYSVKHIKLTSGTEEGNCSGKEVAKSRVALKFAALLGFFKVAEVPREKQDDFKQRFEEIKRSAINNVSDGHSQSDGFLVHLLSTTPLLVQNASEQCKAGADGFDRCTPGRYPWQLFFDGHTHDNGTFVEMFLRKTIIAPKNIEFHFAGEGLGEDSATCLEDFIDNHRVQTRETTTMKNGFGDAQQNEIMAARVAEMVLHGLKEAHQLGDYKNVLDPIKKAIIKHLERDKTVKIKILAVSAKLSFRDLIDAYLDSVVTDLGNGVEIEVELLVAHPDYLKKNELETLYENCKSILSTLRDRLSQNKSLSRNEQISLTVWTYEMLPQIHGVLVGSDDLFFEFTSWNFRPKKPAELECGKRPYFHFKKGDTYIDPGMIEVFDTWFRALQGKGTPLKPAKKKVKRAKPRTPKARLRR